jgi:hypothetical protein
MLTSAAELYPPRSPDYPNGRFVVRHWEYSLEGTFYACMIFNRHSVENK